MNTKCIKVTTSIMLLLLAVICIVFVVINDNQASMPIPRKLTFTGEYSYDGVNWYSYNENNDISALDGDITIKGHFAGDIQEETILNLYCNHIGISMYVNGEPVYMDAPSELKSYGINLTPSMCAKRWEQILCPLITTEDEIEFQFINYHKYGNKAAYKEILSACFFTPLDKTVLESYLKPYIIPFEMVGKALLVVGIMLIGSGISTTVLKSKMANRLFKIGIMTLLVGGYTVFDVMTVYFTDELLVMKTYGGQLCLILGIYFLGLNVCDAITEKRKKIADMVMGVSAIINMLMVIVAISGKVLMYDTRIVWEIMQCIVSLILIILCIIELKKDKTKRVLLLVYIFVNTAILFDLSGVGYHMFCSGICFKISFMVMLIIFLFRGVRQVVVDHQASIRANILEKELEESRITIMISQIQPHFLYNVLGTIRGLCRKEPEQAWEALGDFSKYLQGNMSALENRRLIRFESELRHIETYLKLEKLRLGEKLSIFYDVQTMDFMLPPLTIQPLVENAVKHGLFNKPGGGRIVLRTKQEADSIIISVEDNGIGFDSEAPTRQNEEHAHVGLNNVRNRLEKMTGGQMTIQSTLGEGTIVTVCISANLEIKGEV